MSLKFEPSSEPHLLDHNTLVVGLDVELEERFVDAPDPTASEQKRNTSTGFEAFYLKFKARIWP